MVNVQVTKLDAVVLYRNGCPVFIEKNKKMRLIESLMDFIQYEEFWTDSEFYKSFLGM